MFYYDNLAFCIEFSNLILSSLENDHIDQTALSLVLLFWIYFCDSFFHSPDSCFRKNGISWSSCGRVSNINVLGISRRLLLSYNGSLPLCICVVSHLLVSRENAQIGQSAVNSLDCRLAVSFLVLFPVCSILFVWEPEVQYNFLPFFRCQSCRREK